MVLDKNCYHQTVVTLIRRCLICVCTVCLCTPFRVSWQQWVNSILCLFVIAALCQSVHSMFERICIVSADFTMSQTTDESVFWSWPLRVSANEVPLYIDHNNSGFQDHMNDCLKRGITKLNIYWVFESYSASSDYHNIWKPDYQTDSNICIDFNVKTKINKVVMSCWIFSFSCFIYITILWQNTVKFPY